jgi:hypothetical protein
VWLVWPGVCDLPRQSGWTPVNKGKKRGVLRLPRPLSRHVVLSHRLCIEVYVEQPDGFNESGQSDKVCKLRKALYGVKQSPRVWYFTLTTYLESLGFKPLTSDNCIFFDSKGNYVAIFVDDPLIIVHLSQTSTISRQS